MGIEPTVEADRIAGRLNSTQYSGDSNVDHQRRDTPGSGRGGHVCAPEPGRDGRDRGADGGDPGADCSGRGGPASIDRGKKHRHSAGPVGI